MNILESVMEAPAWFWLWAILAVAIAGLCLWTAYIRFQKACDNFDRDFWR